MKHKERRADSDQCPICRSTASESYVRRMYKWPRGPYLDLVKCRACGAIFVSPLPSLLEIKALYNEAYFEQDYSSGYLAKQYSDAHDHYRQLASETQNMLRKYGKNSGKLLEIGCAGGTFLHYMQRHGWETYGVDVSEWAYAYAQDKFRLNIFLGDLYDAKFPSDRFDVVYMAHVLEHVPDPVGFMQEVNRILKANGLIIVEVPIFVSSAFFRLLRFQSQCLSKLGIKHEESMRLFKIVSEDRALLPYHVVEYSPHTLNNLLTKTGYYVLRSASKVPIPESLSSGSFKSGTALPRWVLSLSFRAMQLATRILNLKAGNLTVCAQKI